MRAAWLEVDLDAYRANLRAMVQFTETPALAIVKANGYGHGLVEIGRAAVEAGAVALGVALPEEGAVLREAGVTARVLVLAPILPDQAEEVAGLGLEPVFSQPELLLPLAEAGRKLGSPVPVHVKVDTGMTRVGLSPESAVEAIEQVRNEPALRLAGVMTHFASPDADDFLGLESQFSCFQAVLADAGVRGGEGIARHAAASSAALCYSPSRLDWIRAGIVAYGAYPSVQVYPLSVTPALSLRSRIVQLRRVETGRAVGYGGSWTTPRPSTLAIVPLGYADGLPCSLSNRGVGLVRGRRAQIRGRVCMDQIILDVTDVPEVELGDRVTLIGTDGEESLRVEEVATMARTTPYEVLTRLSARLPRVFSGESPASE